MNEFLCFMVDFKEYLVTLGARICFVVGVVAGFLTARGYYAPPSQHPKQKTQSQTPKNTTPLIAAPKFEFTPAVTGGRALTPLS